MGSAYGRTNQFKELRIYVYMVISGDWSVICHNVPLVYGETSDIMHEQCMSPYFFPDSLFQMIYICDHLTVEP